MSRIVNSPPVPRLVLLDSTDRQSARTQLPQTIEFQFQPTDFTMDWGAAWASSTGMNRDNPILQFSHGEQKGYQFGARLFAKDSSEDIQPLLDALKLAVEKDDELKRPPRWQFIWGQFIDETVIVKTIGGVKIDELRQDGTLRGATLGVQLLLYHSVDVALVAEDRPTNTFYAVTKSGDTWEDIALREYDEPAYGDILRQNNPGIKFPAQQTGKIVLLPKIENIRGIALEPSSIPMVRTSAGLALRRSMYALRSVSRQSTILKK